MYIVNGKHILITLENGEHYFVPTYLEKGNISHVKEILQPIDDHTWYMKYMDNTFINYIVRN